jgi:hypothetical protein
MDLLEDLDDPHVDLDYVGSDEEMEDDANHRDTDWDTEADTDVDDDDDDHDDDDHDGDDHDVTIAGSGQ